MSGALIPFPILDGFAALERRMDRWRAEIGAPGWTGVVWPEMLGTLRLLRAQLPESEWIALRAFLRVSELASVALEDPMTRWSWDRPRGERADAELTDMAYGHASQRHRIAAATPIGQEVHQAVVSLPSLVALRERLAAFRRLFATTTARNPDAAFLSIGAGHLRSAERVAGGRRPARWVALERDSHALPTLNSQAGVEPVLTSLRAFMNRPGQYGSFDMVTCGALLDLFDTPMASRLTVAGYAALRPGGRLVLANSARAIEDRGYLDVFMDWRPGWRDEAQMDGLLVALPPLVGAKWRHFRGPSGSVVYTEIRKPADTIHRPTRRRVA